MGKQNKKNKMYISHDEWKYEWGGHKAAENRPRRQLPFDRCALSFTPFTSPVVTSEGIVFDILNIIPYLKKHGRNPVTGRPLQAKDLLKITFHKNTEDQYICPITYKVFGQHSHIVVVKPTGNVYTWEAIDTLNIQAKTMVA